MQPPVQFERQQILKAESVQKTRGYSVGKLGSSKACDILIFDAKVHITEICSSECQFGSMPQEIVASECAFTGSAARPSTQTPIA